MGNTGPEAKASFFQAKVSGRVLVIEGDPHVSEVVCITLTQEGYHTVPAETGADALKKIHSEPWDGCPNPLILMNLLKRQIRHFADNPR